VTGHQDHFLSRLDRVSQPSVELSLSLYNDPELLRHILGGVRLPDGAERVAISLDDPDLGPFLVVTRAGRFVTCLAAGMRPYGLPVISRKQLDAITARVEDFRAREEAREKLFPGGQIRVLVDRILKAGDELSREEFIAISSVQPILAREFVAMQIESALDIQDYRAQILRTFKRTDSLKPRWLPLLRQFWERFWAIGHLSVLASMGGYEPFVDKPEILDGIATDLTISTIQQGIVSIAAKGAFCIGKLGWKMLPRYVEAYHKSMTPRRIIELGMALLAIGLCSPGLLPRVREALERRPPSGDEAVDKMSAAFWDFARFAIDEPETALGGLRGVGADECVRLGARMPVGSPFRFERSEDVPADLACSIAVNLDWDFIVSMDRIGIILFAQTWLTRGARAEDLYLPAEFIRLTHRRWTGERTVALLQSHLQAMYRAAEKPPPRPTGPARNGPCPCGSGKKYKRCCGA
jgi:hypothetical protein